MSQTKKLSILISPGNWNPQPWQQGLSESELIDEIHVWPTEANLDKVELLLVWQPLPAGVIDRLPNLKFISSMGAGVDHLLGDDQIPKDLPVMRIVDKYLAIDMTNYVLMSLMIYQRRYHQLIENQKNNKWDRIAYKTTKVGILGLGALGSHLARQLVQSGFEVYGFSRSPKSIEGVKSYAGDDMDEFLQQPEVLVNLLPLNDYTRDILDYGLFSKMQKGAYLINVARGGHMVEADLLKALDDGLLSGATLDVFRKEPLPGAHPFWGRNDIVVTPHVASVTTPDSAINQVLENCQRFINGEALKYLADLERQY
jgi:glyoxylate/hydroxypyruvate reductase A